MVNGDVYSSDESDSKTSVSEVTREMLKLYPYNEGAIIWYDDCLLKYLDSDFFGQIDDTSKFYMWNLQNVNEPNEFNYKTKDLLTRLASEASVSPKLYATSEPKLGKSKKKKKTLYGLTQCTRDLSSADCKICLDASSDVPSYCDGKEGRRVVG